jgi:hypothetical protein
MRTKALTRGIEQLDFLVAALCGVVLLLEGSPLKVRRALQRVNCAGELRKHAVTHQFGDASVMLR